MQDGEKPELRAEMARRSCYLQQRLARCTEEQTINNARILQCQRFEKRGKREYDMGIGNREESLALRFEPFCGRASLAFRTMAVAA